MKKLLIAFIILLLFFNTSKVLAQEKESSPSSELIQVEYELPYPGILPDNPLYFLKAIRDNILKYLIRDPLKKTEFDILQSDKRLGASKSLLEKGKSELAVTTLSKSGNYFDDAISQIQIAKREGKDVKALLEKLYKASLKHQQLIMEMEKDKKGELLLNLKFLRQRAKDFQEKVEIIKSDL